MSVGQPYPAWAAERPLARTDIHGEHGVTLRQFRPSDTPVIRDAGTDAAITGTFPVPSDGSPSSALKYMSELSSRMVRGVALAYAIADENDRASGYLGVGLQNICHGRVSVGCWVAPGCRGNGFQSKALMTVSAWLASAGGVGRVEASIETTNTFSIRAVERAGFEREGLLHRWEIIGGVPRDMYMYAKLL